LGPGEEPVIGGDQRLSPTRCAGHMAWFGSLADT
jgi:hypothetical protein